MRFGRDKLTFLALCVLQDWRHRCSSGPALPDFGLRMALAVLYTYSESGERENYDRFWRNVAEPFESAHSDTARNVFRSNEAHRCFEWISRDVGAPQDTGYRARIGRALRRRSKGRPTGGSLE